MFKTEDPDEIELENSDTDDDESKPKIEKDGEELVRRLKNAKLESASNLLFEELERRK